jgi:N-hydroxyarylamine O-acetyltransferase
MSDDANIDAYFERIGFSGSIAPTLQTLEALCALHPASIPFEGLDPLIGVPVRLELKNLEQKLLFEKRGGYCFEHNLLFKAMLEDLGFEVTGLAAHVDWNHAPEEPPRPPSHMVLLVEVNGTQYLADVGFSAVTPTAPLRLRAETEQQTPHERFRLLGGEPTWRLEVELGGAWVPVYSFETEPRTFDDFVEMNDGVLARGNFRDNVISARHDKGRRVTLRNSELKIHPVGGPTERRTLDGVAGIKDALANVFGIALPPAEKLDPAIERVLAAQAAGGAAPTAD